MKRLVLALLASCAPPAQAPAPISEADVARVLDDFHDAAAHADEARLFNHFADDGVFLGTDGTERWPVRDFRAFVHERFSQGKGWVIHPVRRSVRSSGDVAWFDEDLVSETLGPLRGSGVLTRKNGRFFIAQYNLCFTIPNERVPALRVALRTQAPLDLRARYKIAYDDAVAAAADGNLHRGIELFVSLVPEAKTDPDDDLEFWLHNELTWLHWADGNLAAALAEVDAAKATLDHASLPAEKTRELRLHELWDRAYLVLETSPKDAPLAKERYEALAKIANDHDGMAALDAFFAAKKKDAKAALAAAKKIDIEKDGDLQDLYVVSLALDAGGDKEGAKRVRDRICAGREYLMNPLILRQIQCPK